jgi:hypothetical protein
VPDKKPRMTRTTRHLLASGKSSGLDGILPWHGTTEPSFLPRLAFKTIPKTAFNQTDLATSIAAAAEDGAVFFVDASVFHNRTDPAVVEALLGTPGSTVLIPQTKAELTPWTSTRPESSIAKALAAEHPALREYVWPDDGTWRSTARDYYVTLLGFRKRVLERMESQFRRNYGRAPNAEEVAALRVQAQSTFGERGFLLAKKGGAAKGRRNRFTDEFLVYAAAEHAIITGQGVILLTQDEDLMEQVYKLFWLIDTHYRSMLFADYYGTNFGSFRILPFPALTGHAAESVDSGNNVLVRKPKEIEEILLPNKFDFVSFSCWVVGDYFSFLSFGAERQLERVLRVKAQTGGLNTARLEPRNCHISLAPLELPRHLRNCAGIVHDRRLCIPGSTVAIPMLDIQQSIYSWERFIRLQSSPGARANE